MDSPKYKYKNITDQELMITGFGVVAPGATIETTEEINNPNLELQFDGDDRVGVEPAPKKPKHK